MSADGRSIFRLSPTRLLGAVRFLRDNTRGDGAYEESVREVCDAAEHLLGVRDRVARDLRALKTRIEVLMGEQEDPSGRWSGRHAGRVALAEVHALERLDCWLEDPLDPKTALQLLAAGRELRRARAGRGRRESIT